MHILIQMVAFLLNLKIRLKEMKTRFPIQLTLGQIKANFWNDIPFNSANGKIESNSSITTLSLNGVKFDKGEMSLFFRK